MLTTVADPIDQVAFRQAMGQFASGVTVVTTLGPNGEPTGSTVSAFCSLSLAPPMVLVCLHRGRTTHLAIERAGRFAVNILSCDQAGIARRFAGPRARFEGVGHRRGVGGPHLDGAIAHIDCRVHELNDGGDHVIVLGAVDDIELSPGEPLLYARGAFHDPPDPDWIRATAAAPHEWLVSAPW